MRFTILILATIFFTRISAQHNISGHLISENSEPLVGATVVLLDVDSTMIAFGLTSNKGEFLLDDVESGEYILQATYISYSNYSESLIVDNNLVLDPIQLSPSSAILQEITINADHIPMGVRGDTLSYNASAFKTRPNATVEDLLKQLPGIEVDRNGAIKAQGEDVQNVLVDGKEFFGSDPKMATKNLTAEAVEKVEVFDKKSDIAEFTGVDDGQDEKTINLKLKEDHKKGGFGMVDAAAGTQQSYQSKANYFRFTPTLQASVIFAANNLNEETFSINDRIDFMGGMMEAMASGTINISGGVRQQDGINESLSAGINVNYDFSPKLDFRSHYVLNRNANMLEKSSDIVSFSDEFDFGTITERISTMVTRNHQINTRLGYDVNPFLTFTFKNNVSWSDQGGKRNIESNYTKNTLDQGFSTSSFSSDASDWAFDSNTLIKRKFAKKGRSFISSITLKKANKLAAESFNNINRVSNNSFDLRQRQDFNNQIQQVSASADYTEPFSKEYFFTLQYRYANSQEKPYRTYDESRIDYDKKYVYNIGGFSIKRNRKKLKMTLGLMAQFTSLEGIIDEGKEEISGFYSQLLPSFSLERDLMGGQLINASLRTSVQVPTLEQLLPFPDNTSPNYEFIGNPSLRPAFEQRVNGSYSYYDNFSFTSFWIQLDATRTRDRIVTKTNIDNNLFRTMQPVNTEQHYSVGGYASFSRPLKPLFINYKLRTRVQYAQYESFINDLVSPVTDKNLNFRISIDNRKTKYVSVESGVIFDLYGKRYEISPDFDQNYFNTDYYLEAEFYLPKAWVVSSEMNYKNFSQESFSESTSFALWSARVSKYFLDNKLEISVSAFDLLNQNIGFRRLGSENSLREERFNNLSRYFMLGVTYKIGKGKHKGIQVIIDD